MKTTISIKYTNNRDARIALTLFRLLRARFYEKLFERSISLSEIRERFIFAPVAFEIFENANVANSMHKICDFEVALTGPL